MKVYLAHGSAENERKRGKEVQAKLEEMGIEVYNPFYPPNAPREDILAMDREGERKRRWTELTEEDCFIIVDRDLEAIRVTDVVLALMPNGITYGIPMEMVYARLYNNRPVFVVNDSGIKTHPWIVYHSEDSWNTDDEALEFFRLLTITEEDIE